MSEEVETGDIDIQEPEETIRTLKNNKAPGLDEVPPESNGWTANPGK